MPSYLNERSARPGARPERRRHPRVRVLGELYGRVVAFDAPVGIQNIGLGGFSIVAPLAFPPNAEHKFEVTAPDGYTAIIKGRAAHSAAQTGANGAVSYLTGFELVVTEAQDVTVMADLLTRLSQQALGVA